MAEADALHQRALGAQGGERRRLHELALDTARTAQAVAKAAATETERRRLRTRDEEEAGFLPAERPTTRFRDVIGLDDAKRAIDLALIRPLRHPEEARRLGVRIGGGLLLYGPPGTGKTLLARAVAGEVDAPFYPIKASDIMSQWVGQAERNLARLFGSARSSPRAVIFMDELDALAPARGRNRSTVMARVVPQLLAEMDGFESPPSGLVFIGATNRPEDIDAAVLRPGRLDQAIEVAPPDAHAREELFRLHLRERDTDENLCFADLAARTEGLTGADIAAICRHAAKRAFEAATDHGDPRRGIQERDLVTEIDSLRPGGRMRAAFIA